MRVLLVVADSQKNFPNLVAMKLSEYHKRMGDSVELMLGIPHNRPLQEYDFVYISCIYYQNREKVEWFANQFIECPVQIGGSGWDIGIKLPYEIEHIMPDYSLYGIDYSLGFTSRGCIRNCGFCIVPEKEGYIVNHAPISEFHDPKHKKLMLLDNNFLASPRMAANFDYIVNNELRVNFNQGLDIRLINEDIANVLTQVKCYSWSFKTRGLHFAFDSWRYREHVEEGIKTLVEAGINPKHLMFYVLIGYDTQPIDDLDRVELLLSYDVKPYIMTYNQNANEWTKNFERFINGRYYQFVKFGEYYKGVFKRYFSDAAISEAERWFTGVEK